MPPAVPAPAPLQPSAASRAALIAELRAKLAAAEPATGRASRRCAALPGDTLAPWSLGEPALDSRIGGGLDVAGLHEVRPSPATAGRAAAGDRAAALAFALRLAARRLRTLPATSPRQAVLVASTPESRLDIGALHAAGVAAAGLDPGRLVLVDAANAADALWAIEEGLKSARLAFVVGLVDGIGLTPARRLSLAAAASLTPGLLLPPARSDAAAAVATRWLVGAAPSAPDPFDPAAPGNPVWSVLVERALGAGVPRLSAALRVEWCDEAFRFRLAADVADRAAGAREPARHPCRRAAGAG